MVLNKYAFSLTNSTAGTQGNLRKMTFNKNIMDIGENVTIPSTSLMTYDETIVSNIIARNNLLLGPNTNFSADTTYLYLNTGRSLIYENSNSAPSSTFSNVYFYSPYKRDSIDIFFGSNSVFSSNTSLSILKSSNYSPVPPPDPPQTNKCAIHLIDWAYTDTEITPPTGTTSYNYLVESETNYTIQNTMSMGPGSTIPANSYYKITDEIIEETPPPVLAIDNMVIHEFQLNNYTFDKEYFYLSTPHIGVVDRLPTLEDDFIIKNAEYNGLTLQSPQEEVDVGGFAYDNNFMVSFTSRWSTGIQPDPLYCKIFSEEEQSTEPVWVAPNGIPFQTDNLLYVRTLVEFTDKKEIHLFNFTEANETINEPTGSYTSFRFDQNSNNYVLSNHSSSTPIEVGEYYTYNNPYGYVVIDKTAIRCNPLSPSKTFSTDLFTLGVSYKSITRSNTTVQKSFLALYTIIKNGFIPGGSLGNFCISYKDSNVTQDIQAVCFGSSVGAKDPYYKTEIESPFKVYISANVYFTMGWNSYNMETFIYNISSFN